MKRDSFFQGLKVVEFAGVLAGPAVGMFFAELGAEVIKIENKSTGGDMTRGWKLPSEDPDSPLSAYFCSVNWGKQHLMLDLNDPDDLQTALGHACRADVVISNFKPASARRLGVDAESLHARNPGLIYAQINAFSDPEDPRPAFDVVLQAEAGFLYMTGEAGRPPARMPVALIDLVAAHQLKEAILIALLHHARTGEGSVVGTSLMESALASLANQAGNFLMAGHVPQRMGAQHPNIAPYGDIFNCADGKPVLLAIGTERQFRALCEVLGLEWMLEDPDFQTNKERVNNREALNEVLSVAISTKLFDDLMPQLYAAAVPAAQIRDLRSVFDLPEAQAMILEEKTAGGLETKRVKTVAFNLNTVKSLIK